MLAPTVMTVFSLDSPSTEFSASDSAAQAAKEPAIESVTAVAIAFLIMFLLIFVISLIHNFVFVLIFNLFLCGIRNARVLFIYSRAHGICSLSFTASTSFFLEAQVSMRRGHCACPGVQHSTTHHHRSCINCLVHFRASFRLAMVLLYNYLPTVSMGLYRIKNDSQLSVQLITDLLLLLIVPVIHVGIDKPFTSRHNRRYCYITRDIRHGVYHIYERIDSDQ